MSDETPQEPDAPEIPAEPVNEPEPTEPQYLTMDQVAELLEKRDQDNQHKLQTWLGRRDADLIEKLKETRTPPPDPDQSRESLLENPREFFREELNRMEREHNVFLNNVTGHAGKIMDADPLFADKDLGSEVVKEISKLSGKIDKRLPPDVAAKQLVSDATLAVMRKKRSTPQNPLAGNKPTEGLGTVSPPATPGKPKSKAKITSDLAKRMAAKWNYDDKTLSKLFPAEKNA